MAGAWMPQAGAQSTRTGAGLRLTPDGGGGTIKHFLDPALALEAQLNAGGLMGLEGESFTAVGLLEYHIPLPDPSWRLFFGGGAHIGVWNNRNHYDPDEFIFGVDGIGGVEYVFRNFPLGLTGDFKPAINFVTDVDFFPHNIFGIGARFYFGPGAIRRPTPR